VTFRRLTAGHTIALVAALALLLAMAPDWYTDKQGEQFRDVEQNLSPRFDQESVPSERVKEAEAAEKHEKNAWQADALIDRAILLLLLASAGLAIAAAFLRAAGRSVGPPSPSALASVTGLVASALIAYRIFQPPGLNVAAVVKWGAPLGLVCVGMVAIGSRIAVRSERERPAEEAARTDAPPSPAGAA
jgi:drug/metabolite transporter (DMT)-like permease